MSDFHQGARIATLHRLGDGNLEGLEEQLEAFAKHRPIALVLPSLYSEFSTEAMSRILDELRHVNYLREIILTLGPADEEEFNEVRERMSVLPAPVSVIWNSGPRMSELLDSIAGADLPVGLPGKGRSAWMAYGYVIARGNFRTIALHDCDILTYSREMLARLCYPITNPNLGYEFTKGYYARVTDRLHGRVTRLLVSPLIRALRKIIGHDHHLLRFYSGIRYPLAGEFSMDLRLAEKLRIPGDWGLEVGVLAEVYRNAALSAVCQVDLADNYEHKHQPLSPEDASKGLHKMCVDICKTLFRALASEGVLLSPAFFNTLVATYVRTAQDMLVWYEDDARINGLDFDRHGESSAVETFHQGIIEAAKTIEEYPLGVPLIASWTRVRSALPRIYDELLAAVRADNA